MAESADVKKLEAAFRDAPKGSAESNKAFRAWREAVAAEPAPAAKKAVAAKKRKAR